MNKQGLILIAIVLLLSTGFLINNQSPTPKPLAIPTNFPSPTYDISKNPLTEEGFALGRKLFYDPLLSKDGSISCASCHQQDAAFIQADHDLSHGVEDRLGKRNALPIFNALFRKSFFWDGGVPKLDFVPVNPIENELEMDEKMDNVVHKLNVSPNYRALFKNAFNIDTISSKEILQAFAQFMYAMVSANSKYDRYIRKENTLLDKEELAGLSLFKDKCASCHSTDLFTDDCFRNNGLDNDHPKDKGREEITLNVIDRAKFKVPSLRNVALTAPYMHDGRFNSLEEVMDHYASGVKNSSTLDPLLQSGSRLGVPLSSIEKKQLILFLNTLTDSTLIQNNSFSNPKHQ